MARVFRNRTEAGTALAARLEHLRGDDIVVLGLPRGGVPVAFAIGQALDAPHDVIVVRKIGVPGQPELAMGAIGGDGARVVNDDVVRLTGVPTAEFIRVEQHERASGAATTGRPVRRGHASRRPRRPCRRGHR